MMPSSGAFHRASSDALDSQGTLSLPERRERAKGAKKRVNQRWIQRAQEKIKRKIKQNIKRRIGRP
jgi:hypothetical protein